MYHCVYMHAGVSRVILYSCLWLNIEQAGNSNNNAHFGFFVSLLYLNNYTIVLCLI